MITPRLTDCAGGLGLLPKTFALVIVAAGDYSPTQSAGPARDLGSATHVGETRTLENVALHATEKEK